jgi:hypothetical protein
MGAWNPAALFGIERRGAPGGIRTRNTGLRTPLLYPFEPRGRDSFSIVAKEAKMRASVFGFREVEAEEGCVVAELPGPGLWRLLKEYERSPWWLRILCARSYQVSAFALNLFLDAPFPLWLEGAFKDGVAIEDPERRIFDVQSYGEAWREASLILPEAFSGPETAGFSTLEATFLGGLGEERAAFRTLYRIDMWERRCEVEVRLRGARLVWAVLSEKNAQWGWDLRLGGMDGVKVAAVAGVPSEDVPAVELILAADVGDERDQADKRGTRRRTRSRSTR